jgi:hypothetical protein
MNGARQQPVDAHLLHQIQNLHNGKRKGKQEGYSLLNFEIVDKNNSIKFKLWVQKLLCPKFINENFGIFLYFYVFEHFYFTF